MKHALEALLARAVAAGVTALPRRQSLAAGAALGDVARRLGLRRAVAEANLVRAFPERGLAERRAILVEHYRELGRVACEYPRLAELVHAAEGEVVAPPVGIEHLDAAAALGRGVILLTGHYGNFELLGAWLGRRNPVDFVVKPLSNPRVEAMLALWRRGAGVGSIAIGAGAKRIFAALKQKRWVAMLADQDARRSGLFVPFLGVPSSTPPGPAAIALRTGAPIVMGFCLRLEDGRHQLTVAPPLLATGDGGPNAVRALTAAHAAVLEEWVRRHPAMWFWLHRRWKTPPPSPGEEGGA